MASLHNTFPQESEDVSLRAVAQELITTKVGPALGDGDLFAGFQVEPLAALMVSLGLSQLTDEADAGAFAFRLAMWDDLPDDRKYFQLFGGMETIKKYVRTVALMIMAGWDFYITSNDTGIEPLSHEEFNKLAITGKIE